MSDLGEQRKALLGNQTLLVLGTIGRKAASDVKQVSLYLVAHVGQHACNSQRIATIVARSGKDHDGIDGGPFLGDDTCESMCSAFHQINRCYWLIIDGIGI